MCLHGRPLEMWEVDFLGYGVFNGIFTTFRFGPMYFKGNCLQDILLEVNDKDQNVTMLMIDKIKVLNELCPSTFASCNQHDIG